jgi:hypothetical protein
MKKLKSKPKLLRYIGSLSRPTKTLLILLVVILLGAGVYAATKIAPQKAIRQTSPVKKQTLLSSSPTPSPKSSVTQTRSPAPNQAQIPGTTPTPYVLHILTCPSLFGCGESPFTIAQAGPCNNSTQTSCALQFTSDQEVMAFVSAATVMESETTYDNYNIVCASSGCSIPPDSCPNTGCTYGYNNSVIKQTNTNSYNTNLSTTACCSLLNVKSRTQVTVSAPATYNSWSFDPSASASDSVTYVMKFDHWATTFHTQTPSQNKDNSALDQAISSFYVAPVYVIGCHYLGNQPPCTP